VAPVITEEIPLAPLTALGLGGPARFYADIGNAADLRFALRWADERALPIFILGGGSNLVVADEGFPGLVLRMRSRGMVWSESGDETLVDVQAGQPWDEVVGGAIRHKAAGIECLSGIPGSAGAAPVQNIGAYGQEVGDVIRRVRVLDRRTYEEDDLDRDACAFAYRDSLFRRDPGRYVILSVSLRLVSGGPPCLAYEELATALRRYVDPSLPQVRDMVLLLRRRKSMLLEEKDENRRSVGSFFKNPIVAGQAADALAGRAAAEGLLAAPQDMPRFPLADGRVKLAAGWLIERAGLAKGLRMGAVGISSKHALALVHHGGGTTAELVRLAVHVRTAVRDRFGITLVPEPVFVGLDWPA